MASETATISALPDLDLDWDEAKIIASLARLQSIHVQLRQLRDSVAQIVEPTISQQASPEDLFVNFSLSAKCTANGIKSFTELIGDSQSKEIFEKAKESRALDPEGIKGWLVTEHEDWLEVNSDDVEDKAVVEEEVEELHGKVLDINMNDIHAALDKYKEMHPEIKTSISGDSKIEIHVPGPAYINFDIELGSALETQSSYNVTCKGNSRLHAAIQRSVAARPRPKDLGYLLEMLASYMDLNSTPCFKCRRLLDQNALFPALRTRRNTKEADGRFCKQWLAFHPGCV